MVPSTNYLKLLGTLAAFSGDLAKAHSWIHCSDYRGSTRYFEKDACYGHPRPGNGRQVPDDTPFGVDIGFNEQPGQHIGSDVDRCQVQGQLDYRTDKPMAQYRPGQTITLAWPSKNHVAATCTSKYIPDTSLKLFVAPVHDSGHPTEYTQVKASFSDKPHKKDFIDFQGFQNCPAFCENMDKSLCTGTFVVPALDDGIYTFQWNWVFNADTDPYVTCFEAYVGMDVTPVASPTHAPTVEGQTYQPTVVVTMDPTVQGQTAQPSMLVTKDPDACESRYDSCTAGECCEAGTSCMRKDQHYSQCLDFCPEGEGWECEGASPTTKPVSTSSPTAANTASGGCVVGYGSAGILKKPKGGSSVTAKLKNGCDCAKFCTVFAPSSKFFQFKTGKCSCYSDAKGVKKKDGSAVAGVVPLEGFVWSLSL